MFFSLKNIVATAQERQNTEGTIKIAAFFNGANLVPPTKNSYEQYFQEKKRHPNLTKVLIEKLLSPIGYIAREKMEENFNFLF
jgi:hypothetical protein